MNVTPHVSQNTKRTGGSAIDGRTTRHEGYQVSQRKRKAHRGGFRLDQNGWDATKDPASRTGNSKVGIYVHGYGLQPGANAESDVAGSSVCISPGRAAF